MFFYLLLILILLSHTPSMLDYCLTSEITVLYQSQTQWWDPTRNLTNEGRTTTMQQLFSIHRPGVAPQVKMLVLAIIIGWSPSVNGPLEKCTHGSRNCKSPFLPPLSLSSLQFIHSFILRRGRNWNWRWAKCIIPSLRDSRLPMPPPPRDTISRSLLPSLPLHLSPGQSDSGAEIATST